MKWTWEEDGQKGVAGTTAREESKKEGRKILITGHVLCVDRRRSYKYCEPLGVDTFVGAHWRQPASGSV